MPLVAYGSLGSIGITPSVRRGIYLSLQAAMGSRAAVHYAEFSAVERNRARLTELHETRLQTTLAGALKVPYYQKRVSLNREPCLADMPIVTRTDLTEHFNDFVLPIVGVQRSSGVGLYGQTKVTSGGSSGQPVAVIHGRYYRDRGRAARMYSQGICGFPFGTPYIRLWGSMRDINAARSSMTVRLADALAGVMVLNGFRQDAISLERHIETINSASAQHLMGYADAITEVAQYAKDHALPVRPLKSIMCCAGTLTPQMRALISDVFKGSVRNKYGTRECADIACECECGRMHIYTNNIALEVVDDKGSTLPPGARGRLLITLLNNTEFPLVRYEVGDIGALGFSECECRRAFPVLETVEGRNIEFVTDVAGFAISPVFIRHIVGVVHHRAWIRRYRLTQREASYELLLQTEPVDAEVVDRFRRDIIPDLLSVIGNRASIQVIVDNSTDDREKWLSTLKT